jgi:putative two-component system response regulator
MENASVLVVEDDHAMLVALKDILETAGFQVRTATHGEAALESFRQERPSLILSDIAMPGMDGIMLFEAVRDLPGGKETPFVFLTARGAREDVFAGRSLGVDDYITKPISSHELLTAVRSRLRRSNEIMFEKLKSAYKLSLLMLAAGIEARDQYTYLHLVRLNAYSNAMAQELGWSESRLEALEYGALLHDIGKLDINRSILEKKEPLTAEEWKEMRRHTEYGAFMIEKIDQHDPLHYLAPAIPIVLYHHEAWDGSGYPEGLKGDEIPEEARLLAVVDSFDAMTSDRPYRLALGPSRAFEEIKNRAGSQFDPKMVDVFVHCWEKGIINKIMDKLKNDTEDKLELIGAKVEHIMS